LSNTLCFAALFVLVVTRMTYAQSAAPAPPPYRGLFGPTEHDNGRPDRFDLRLSPYEAFDDNSRFVTETDLSDATLQDQRWYEGLQADFGYRRTRPTSVWDVTAASTIRQYPGLASTTEKMSGGVSVELRPDRQWRIQLSDSISYSPYFQLAPAQAGVDADAPAASIDYSVSRQAQMIYGSSGGITYLPTRRAEVTVNYGWRLTDFLGDAGFVQRSIGGRFTYALSRDLRAQIGYHTSAETMSDFSPIRHDDLDLGVDYRRSLSITRRTTFTVSTGSVILSAEDGRHFGLTGTARLAHQMSAQWGTQLEYQRGVQVIPTVPRPYLATTLTGQVSGYANHRLFVRWRPIYSSGVGASDGAATFHSVSSELRGELALDRRWAFYAEHFLYSYEFSPQSGIPAVLAGGVARNGVRFGVMLWTPLNGR
jgi:hypothetical protein